MRISIFGLGYVGAVSAGCLASDGHEVIGVDPYQTKVDLINKGVTPIIEKDIGEMIAKTAAAGKLRATTDVHEAVMGSDISLICVGTPSQLNGNLDLSYVRRVCEEIIEFMPDNRGSIQLGDKTLDMDYRLGHRERKPAVEFTFGGREGSGTTCAGKPTNRRSPATLSSTG